ncbi:hypothetical protein [Saccharopolyspora sp. ASAGF58]|uniref:hypothetical protein n=1 Tax=Saccharopolyspora sp. ASAGF58 TaxID=2719023 RepID=UPI001444F56D|nr:hypothetical protein [Saccharopolyspora sp. ASAGF58]
MYCNNKCRAYASIERRKTGTPPPAGWQYPALQSSDPVLHAAALRGRQLGEANGWSPSTIRCTMDGLSALLNDRIAGHRVALSEIRARTSRHTSTPRVAEVLADLGLLDENTTPAIRSWIDHRTGELPVGFASPIRDWLLVLLDGDTRARPRSHSTIYVYFGPIRPIVERWAAERGHLREITRTDITTALDQLRGWQRRNAITALRSLFRFAKRHGIVFANPTTRLKTEDIDHSLLPMTDTEIRAVEQVAISPAQRVIVALIAVHAARPKSIRNLLLDPEDGHRRIWCI